MNKDISYKKFILLFFLFGLEFLNAQQSTGLLLNNDAYNQVPHLPVYSGGKYNNVPISYSLRPFAPKVGDQGAIGSCTGWASGYAALTISRAVRDSIVDQAKINELAHSALYIYNNIKINDDCNSGAFLHQALEFLKVNGDCFDGDFSINTCDTLPPLNFAQRHNFMRIKEYAAVYSILDNQKVKIDKVKKSLAANKPVIVGVNISQDFLTLNQEIWEQDEGANNIGGHAMCVIGYDDVLQAFEVMNSWGSNWGADDGFVWIPYDVFDKNALYGYQIILDDKKTVIEKSESEKKEQTINKLEGDYSSTLAGTFDFKNLIGYKKNEENGYLKNIKGGKILEFGSVSVELRDSIYVMEANKWSVGDLFQLNAANVPEGNYVYVCSIDSDNHLNVHWPRESENNIPVANYIPSDYAEIVIPGDERALKLETSGKNYLLVLYSNQPIDDFNVKAKAIRDSEQSKFYSRVTSVLGDILIPYSNVKYDTDSMKFEAALKTDNHYVVPVILEVNAVEH